MVETPTLPFTMAQKHKIKEHIIRPSTDTSISTGQKKKPHDEKHWKQYFLLFGG